MMLVKWQNCSDCKDANEGYNENQKKINKTNEENMTS
jgi:hypothetical protein